MTTSYQFSQLINFTNTTTASFVGSNGLIQMTQASRNLLTFTQQFDNAVWTKSNVEAYPFNPVAATLGQELVTNGTFDSGISGWTQIGGGSMAWQSPGGIALTDVAGADSNAQTNITTVAGRFYEFRWTVVSSPAGDSWRARIRNATDLDVGTNLGVGSYVRYFTASVTGTNTVNLLSIGAGQTVVFDNISVREVIGGLITAPDGTPTASTMLARTGSAISTYIGQTVGTLASTIYTASWFVKPGTHNFVQLAVSSQAADWCNFTLFGNGSVQNNGSAVGAISYDVDTGYYRISMTYTAVGVGRHAVLALIPSGTSTRIQPWNPIGTESVFLWGAQFEIGSMLTDYTRNVGGRFPARFDYDPVTLAAKGILIEEQRTNLLLQTEDFATSWTPTRASVSVNVTTSPDGTVDADKIVEDLSNNSHFIDQLVSSVAGSANVAVSIYAKAAGRNFLAFVTRDSAGVFRTSYFNLSNGTLGTIATGHTASIQSLGNNWYRCMIVTTQGATTGNFTFYPGTANVNGSVTYQGDGTSGIFVWGAQLEVGAFATSYIPNVATAGGVIRAPDQANISAPMFAPWYNQTEGTFVWEYSRVAPPNGGRVFASGVGGSNSYGIWVNTATGSQDQVTVRDISGDAVAGVLFSVNSTGTNKGAVAYKDNDFAWASNGAAPATDNTGVVPSLSDQLRLGRAINTDASYLNGHIRSITYYPERLSNARLQELSTL